MNIGAGADPSEDAFLLGETASHCKSVIVADLDALNDLGFTSGIFEMEVVGDESGSGALDFVWSWLQRLAGKSLRNDWRVSWLHGDRLKRGFAGAERLYATGDRSACSNGRDENVHLAIGVGPDFFSGRFGVDRRIGWIIELLRHPCVRSFLNKGLRLGDSPFHSLGARSENQLGAEHGEEGTALEAHCFRHGEDDLVAFCCSNEGKSDAGISTCRLDDDGVWLEDATLLGIFDHGHADAVFHAPERIEELAFESDGGIKTGCDAVEFNQGCVAHGFDDVVVNLSHRFQREIPITTQANQLVQLRFSGVFIRLFAVRSRLR